MYKRMKRIKIEGTALKRAVWLARPSQPRGVGQRHYKEANKVLISHSMHQSQHADIPSKHITRLYLTPGRPSLCQGGVISGS